MYKIRRNSIIISIVLSYVIPYLLNSDKFTFASLLLKIGRDIYYENFNKHWAYYNKINKINKSNARSDISEIEIKFLDRDFKISNRSFTKKVDFIDFIIYNNQDIFPISDEKDFISLALDLLEFISDLILIKIRFKLGNVWTSDGKLSRKIFADVDFNEMLLNLFNNELDKFPMIYKPKDWKIVTSDVYSKNNPAISKYGGFLLNEENLFYRSSKLNIGKINFNTNVVINCINKLASIRLSINTNVLSYILNLIYKDNFSKIKDLIYLKPHPSTNQLYKLKQAKEINEILEIERHNNKYYIDISTLNTALLLSIWLQLSKVNSYYLPIFIDWRGRFYTDTVFSYQGGELARSLILFREGKILNDTGLINLKIYTANCFGLNRYSHAYRIKWTEDNLDSILNLEPGFIFSAKEPFLFLACAFELKSYFKDPKNFISTLPIYLDATCNGLQHLASMIQDVNLSKLVNLYSSNEFNKPEDLYSSMINYVNKEIDLVIKEYPP